MQLRISLGPGAVRKAERDAAPHLQNVHSQGKLRDHNGIVRNVVELGFEIDARALVVEPDKPAYRSASIERAAGLDRPGDRSPGCAHGAGMIARAGNSR